MASERYSVTMDDPECFVLLSLTKRQKKDLSRKTGASKDKLLCDRSLFSMTIEAVESAKTKTV